MIEWIKNLSVLEHIYFWLGIVSTIFLIVQIIMMCFSSFGGDADADMDGDGVIDGDTDTDSGVSIFTVKSITAFLAVGSWSGLLTCSLASEKLQWLSVIIAVVAGGIAMTVVVLVLNALRKLQCNGAIVYDKLVGQRASVYVSIPPSRSGRGKITLNAQGKYIEIDALTDSEEKLAVDEKVEIIATENECAIVKRIEGEAPPEQETEQENKLENKNIEGEE